MDLVKAILYEHSKQQTLKIVRYVGHDAERFATLVAVFLKGPYRITQRAAWPLSVCVEKHPDLVFPHLNAILKQAQKSGVHDSVKRNTVRLLQYISIPVKLEGKVADMCFKFFQSRSEPIGVRVFSMTVLAKIAKRNPELNQELRMMIEDELPYAGPAFLSRAKRVLKQIG